MLGYILFDKAVSRMSNGKATGPDGIIPVETIKYSKSVKDTLFSIMSAIWDTEMMSVDFVDAKFFMFFKNKDSTNNPSKYRCITLLNHSYKILSQIIQARLMTLCEDFLAD